MEEYIAKGGYAAFEKALFEMSGQEICQEIQAGGTAQEICQRLVTRTLDSGAPDNVTVVLFQL